MFILSCGGSKTNFGLMEFIKSEITVERDLHDKWNGKFLDETSYDTVVHSRGVGQTLSKYTNHMHH